MKLLRTPAARFGVLAATLSILACGPAPTNPDGSPKPVGQRSTTGKLPSAKPSGGSATDDQSDNGGSPSPGASKTPGASTSPGGSPNPSASPGGSPTPSTSPGSSPTPSGSPTTGTSPTPSATTGASPSPTPSPTPTPPSTEVTTFAGAPPGESNSAAFADAPGPGTLARFERPTGLLHDGAGNLFVVDNANRRVRKIVIATGAVSTIAGNSAEGSADNDDPLLATFKSPTAIARASNGDLYISDSGNTKIRKIEAIGGGNYGKVTTLAGTGVSEFEVKNGPGAQATFFKPQGIAVVGQALYVVDGEPGLIRKIDLASPDHQVTTWIGGGENRPPATGTSVVLATPHGMTAMPDGSLLFVEQLGTIGGILKASVAGEVTVFAGAGKGDQLGAASNARFDFEGTGGALTVGSDGTVYVADASNHKIKKIKDGQVTLVAGAGTKDGFFVGGAYADGPASAAKFNLPLGLALDERDAANPVLYVADTENNRIRKIPLK